MARNKQKTIAVTEETHRLVTQFSLYLSHSHKDKMTMDETLTHLVHATAKLMGLVALGQTHEDAVKEATAFATKHYLM